MKHRCYACNERTDAIGCCYNHACENYRGNKRTDSVHYNYHTPLATDTRRELEGHPWAFYAQIMPFPLDRAHVKSVGNVSLFAQFEDSPLGTVWFQRYPGLMHLADFWGTVEPQFSEPSCEPWWNFLVNEIDHSGSMLEFPMTPYSWEEFQAELEKYEPWFCFDGVMMTRLPGLGRMECLSYESQPFMLVPPFPCLNVYPGIFDTLPSINAAGFQVGERFAANPPAPSPAVSSPEEVREVLGHFPDIAWAEGRSEREGRAFTCTCDVAPLQNCPVHGAPGPTGTMGCSCPGAAGVPGYGECSGCGRPFTEAGGLRIAGISGSWCVRCCKTKQVELNASRPSPPAVDARPHAVETVLAAERNAEGSPEPVYGEDIRSFLPERGRLTLVCNLAVEHALVNEKTCKKCGRASNHLDSEGLCLEHCAPF